jgi:DNA polymerase bacteriophage-type
MSDLLDEDLHEHVRWWDDLELTGKTEAARQKQLLALNERLEKLYAYCKQDVEAERLAEKHLYPLSDYERQVYLLDQKINDRGIGVDLDTTRAALELIDRASKRLDERIAVVTQGSVTALTQRDRLVAWLASKGCPMRSLDKQGVSEALSDKTLPAEVREALELRQLGAKSSVRKLQAIINQASTEGRVHGNLLYHGATTGRFSGKGVQLQNLPRPQILNEPEDAIPYILRGDLDEIEMCFGPPQQVASDVIRSLFQGGPGKVLYAADFAAIEARVLAWVAGQNDLVEQFKNGEDIYCSFGSRMYGKTINKKDHPKERQISKGVVLGAGFMLGAIKFQASCEKQGLIISFEEAEKAIKAYRSTYKHISRFWYDIERAAIRAVNNPTKIVSFKCFKFRMKGTNLRLLLPSGRVLNYPYARVVKNTTPWGDVKDAVEVMAVNAVTRKWEPAIISPGTWTENVVQAIARDLMVAAMFRLEQANYPVVLTVHDEVVSEVDEGYGDVKEYENLVAETPDWASGLPVAAEGWFGKRYRK